MAKYIMEFDYYEDTEAFDLASRGADFAAVLHDYAERLRHILKYTSPSPEAYAAYSNCQEIFFELIQEIGGLP